jgi:hypothetical protein
MYHSSNSSIGAGLGVALGRGAGGGAGGAGALPKMQQAKRKVVCAKSFLPGQRPAL